VIAVDTNVLVRVLVDDPGQKAQVAAARSQVKRAGQVWVAQIVQAETVWVLESAYGLTGRRS
jgi:predicted nucleic-acid-binding protein